MASTLQYLNKACCKQYLQPLSESEFSQSDNGKAQDISTLGEQADRIRAEEYTIKHKRQLSDTGESNLKIRQHKQLEFLWMDFFLFFLFF